MRITGVDVERALTVRQPWAQSIASVESTICRRMHAYPQQLT